MIKMQEEISMTDKAVPLSEKFLLSFEEASQYFGIGINKLRRMAEDTTDWWLWSGQVKKIKRVQFEKYLLDATSI